MTNQLLTQYRDLLGSLLEGLQDSTIEHAVEIGTLLWAMIKDAEGISNDIKARIRDEALDRLQQQPGTLQIGGTDEGSVSVTVPTPKLKLSKDADIDLLLKVLGDDIGLYLESKVTYSPRKMTPELISQMEDGQAKTILLGALEEMEGTPRVSFKKL